MCDTDIRTYPLERQAQLRRQGTLQLCPEASLLCYRGAFSSTPRLKDMQLDRLSSSERKRPRWIQIQQTGPGAAFTKAPGILFPAQFRQTGMG